MRSSGTPNSIELTLARSIQRQADGRRGGLLVFVLAEMGYDSEPLSFIRLGAEIGRSGGTSDEARSRGVHSATVYWKLQRQGGWEPTLFCCFARGRPSVSFFAPLCPRAQIYKDGGPGGEPPTPSRLLSCHLA